MSIMQAVPEVGPFTRSVEVSADHPRDRLATDVAAAIDGAEHPQVWLTAVGNGDDETLRSIGLEPYRDLLQLRRPLPAPPSGLSTRAFEVGRDEAAFVEVNNAAFSWHPEQGGLTVERLRHTMTEPWFDADGFRLHEVDGRLAGFCWTKVHAQENPPLGEIYVIGIHPDFHGRGLGVPMTLAGLDHLASVGLTVANLYVEADNHPALRTYDRIGFSHHSTNRAYRLAADAPASP